MSNYNFKQLKDELIASLSKEFLSMTVDLWFSDLTVYSYQNDRVVLYCDSDYKRSYIEEKYKKDIERHLKEILKKHTKVSIVSADTIEENAENISIEDILPNNNVSQSYGNNMERDENPFSKSSNVFESSASNEKRAFSASPFESDNSDSTLQNEGFQQQRDIRHEDYTFSNFIVGSSNEFAYKACMAVIDRPAVLYNPLFIHGASGLGKTHLLHAMYNEAKRKYPSLNIMYTSGEEFANQLILAIHKNKAEKMEEFRRKYRYVDILLIDDIHFISNKRSTQEEFFHTFNSLFDMKKQIILTSDRAPGEIEFLEERLKTRFAWGLITDIQPPNLELRAAIFRNKAESMNVDIPQNALIFLAENVRDSVRQIEGVIKTLRAHSLISGKRIDLDLVKNVLGDYLSKERENITPEMIIDFFCQRYTVKKDDLLGQSRSSQIKTIRHLCIYVIKTLTNENYKSIGKIFNKDRTSIMYSHGQIEKTMNSDREFSRTVDKIIAEIRELAENS
ncbi:MAG: chromosomal replication initiator protein DnaA [Clostridia bacterium]|nr:chromosomal replication initiator protein DnaA [Clostridia bacterium]